MESSQQRKKKKRPSKPSHHKESKNDNHRGEQRHNQQQQLHQKQLKHQEALALSHQLRQLSSQKRLKECLALYRSSINDALRDAHHGSIVVDCCARCGDVSEAEKVVAGMLRNDATANNNLKQVTKKSQPQTDSQTQQMILGPHFWKEYNQNSLKQVPIQAWTALLKGYVHSGMMDKADSLFCHLCTRATVADTAAESSKKRKRDAGAAKLGKDHGRPNVRTLNTLLRGCLWTATSLNLDDDANIANESNSNNKHKSKKGAKKKYTDTHQDTKQNLSKSNLVGGAVTAERAWCLCTNDMVPDSSSYEYTISLLSQSLQCEDARSRLQEMKRKFNIPSSNDASVNEAMGNIDPTLLESLAVCLVVISRSYALLGNINEGQKCAEEAIEVMDHLQSSSSVANPSSSQANSDTTKKTMGGKQAWKSKHEKSDANNLNDNNNHTGGRREESNQLFRSHRLTELRSEALTLVNLCSTPPPAKGKQNKSENPQKQSIVTQDANYVARWMLTRLFYFSGGGTTGLESNTVAVKENEKDNANTNGGDIQQIYSRWIHSLWNSFGLKETVRRLMINDNDHEATELANIFPSKKRQNHRLPCVLSPDTCTRLRNHLIGEQKNVINNSGFINFTQVFSPLQDNATSSSDASEMPLHIELGAGSGDWVALQAQLNPSENYVTVELRSDRVAQTFSKCILHQQNNNDGRNDPLTNVCCVGSECGLFLRERITPGTVRTVFVNHPEPPTQTYELQSHTTGNTSNTAGEEPAHMLNSQTILAAARCLEANGKGRLIIVTDNLIYARLICRTMAHILDQGKLVGLSSQEVRDLRWMESFGSALHLYEGKPSISIGHYIPNDKFSGGTSYFDRLWRTGAGKHADMRKRFVIAVRTCGGSSNLSSNYDYAKGASMPWQGFKHNAAANAKGTSKNCKIARGNIGSDAGNKANNKRSAEKQRLRNERRMLKKQQMAQSENTKS